MSFKLHLDFGRLNRVTHERVWECGEDIVFEPGSASNPNPQWLNNLPGAISGYKIREQSLVKARLTVPPEWLEAGEEFILQAGGDPDSKIQFSRRSYDNGVMLGDDDGRPDILYDTMGPTLLSLIRVGTGNPLLVIKINVEPDPFREEVVRGVVDELTRIAPYVLSSSSEWQNVSMFKGVRQVGAASYAAPEVEFKAISTLVDRMAPILQSISSSPAYSVVKGLRKVSSVRARKLSRTVARKMMSCFPEGGDFGRLPARIDAYVHVRSIDVKAHRVIAVFLECLKRRLDRIFVLAHEQIQKYSDEIDKCESMCSQIPHKEVRSRFSNVYRFHMESLRKHQKAIKDVLPKIKVVAGKLNSIRRMQPFRNVNLRDACPLTLQDFEYDARYQRCFLLMVDYENGHHWWRPLEDGRGWTHSLMSLERGRYGNSLQRKYSILFEYWCCFRLLQAFKGAGFNFADALEEFRLRLAKSIVIECEEGSFEPVGTFRDDNGDLLEVRIIHNYSAYSPNINPTARFKTSLGIRYKKDRLGVVRKDLGEKFLETPDIALVMRNKNTGKWFWFTMDAKSSDSLTEHQVIKQNNYLSQLHTPEFDLESEYRPWASWLVYAGSLHGVAGLENVVGEDDSLREWAPNDINNIDLYQNGQRISGIECSVREGLKLNKKSDNRFMGQIRVNPITAPYENDSGSPFDDFAKMMIVTAQRNLR